MKRPPHLIRYFDALRRKRPGGVAERRRQKLRSLVQPTQTATAALRLSPTRVALGVGTAILLSILLSIHLMPNHVSWHSGDIADREIVAPRSVHYIDSEATRLMQDQAALQVEPRYDAITGATDAAESVISIVFDRVAASKSSSAVLPLLGLSHSDLGGEKASATTPIAPITALIPSATASPLVPSSENEWQKEAERIVIDVRQQTGTSIAPVDVVTLLRQKPEIQTQAHNIALQLVDKEMSRAITDSKSELQEVRAGLVHATALNSLPTADVRLAVAAIAAAALGPNRHYNAIETDRIRESARIAVPPQQRRLTAGTVILRAGDKVTALHIDQFKALGLQSSRPDAITISVITILIFCLTGLVALYLRQFHPEIYRSDSSLLLLSILSIISVAGLKVGSTLLGLSTPGVQFGYLGMMCVASAGMVIALLLSPRAALLVVALLSAVSGIILNNELRFALVTLGSSLTGIVAVTTLKNRNDLLRAVLLLCGTNALLNVLIGHLEGDIPRELGMSALWGIVAGVFALALFYFGVALFEKWFGITTHLRLLELSDPATPLLQEFRLRVPGTYAHSLMVSNLAHAAAEAIGADALLVRVAAYYHDIGKMNRPEFFIENQSGQENIHDRLAPSLSAIILASHVKEGVEMAEEIGLPSRVRELIEQHHGTTLMRYFYHRATQGAPNPMLEAQFRYPGPKPQSREAAILLLADSVEAASRTLQRPTPARITEFVAHIVEEKRADNQLTECDLTLRDLATVQEVFSRTLCGALHARIEYPDEKKTAEPLTLSTASVGTTSHYPLPPMPLPTRLSLRDLDRETKGPTPDSFPLMTVATAETDDPLRHLSLPESLPLTLGADLADETGTDASPTLTFANGETEPTAVDSEARSADNPTTATENESDGNYPSSAVRRLRSLVGHGRNNSNKAPRKRR